MKKNTIFHILNVFIIVLIYLTIDLILSKTLYKDTNCFNHKYFENGYYYDLKKNCESKYRFKSGFPSVDLITDQYGLRTSKIYKSKKENKKNIFLLGDSFTFGVGLNYENTYAGIIEKNLKSYNLYNFAVGSYSPTVHLFRLEQAIKEKIIPNKVLLFLDLTDVIDESQRWITDTKLNLPIRPEPRKNKKKSFIHQNFKFSVELFSIIKSYIKIFKNKYLKNQSNKKRIKTSIQGQFTYTSEKNLNKIFWKDGDFLKGLKKIDTNIKKISSITNYNNAELYIIIYPWAETLEFGQKKFNWEKFVSQLCKKHNCKLINAIPAFERYKENNLNWSSDLYFIGDEHFNKGGAKLLADVVVAALKKID